MIPLKQTRQITKSTLGGFFMSKRRKYLPEEKLKQLKSIYWGISFAVQIRIQPIVECDFPINVLGYLYRKQVSKYKFGNKYHHFMGA